MLPGPAGAGRSLRLSLRLSVRLYLCLSVRRSAPAAPGARGAAGGECRAKGKGRGQRGPARTSSVPEQERAGGEGNAHGSRKEAG